MSSSASLDHLARTSFPSTLPTATASPTTENPPPFPDPDPVPKAHALSVLLSRSDTFTTHLLKVLATPGGQDRLLCTANYTLTLLSASLTHILESRLQKLATSFAENASKALLPGETVVATIPAPALFALLARLSTSSKILASTISEYRIFVRLWGLLGIYAWGKSVCTNPPRDALLRYIAYTQVAVNTCFQVLENRAYLASKSVVARPARAQVRDWCWSSRCWAVHTSLEFVRLWRQSRIWAAEEKASAAAAASASSGADSGAAVREKGVDVWWKGDNASADEATAKRAEEKRLWRKDLLVNAAYMPMTIHWSIEQGYLSQLSIGVLGLIAGGTGLREVWRATA